MLLNSMFSLFYGFLLLSRFFHVEIRPMSNLLHLCFVGTLAYGTYGFVP